MSEARRVPSAVLSARLSEAIRGRPVRNAVFTSFTFDPGFFEQNILPVLFDQPFSQVDKVRALQLEEALRSAEVAVYYDRGALSPDAAPARLDYRRIDVGRRTGVFHPKLVLLLVDELWEGGDEDAASDDHPLQSLIVGVLSANLTRSGWWENVECAHIGEIQNVSLSGDRCSFRRDLLGLLPHLRASASPSEEHAPLDAIHTFLLECTDRRRFTQNSVGGRILTRLFYGQGRESLSVWLEEILGRFEWNLEVISPYFDPHGAGPLEKLIASIEPRETRVFLPREADGAASVTNATYDAVAAQPQCHWSRLPNELLQRGTSGTSQKLAPRRVHAKVYRFWGRDVGDVLLVGSVNLTDSAHSHAAAGNLEAAFLIDISDAGLPRRWWLDPVDSEPERFADTTPTEEDGLLGAPLDLSVRYEWNREQASYRMEGPEADWIELAEVSGRVLARIERPTTNSWVDLGDDAAAQLAGLLRSTSFLTARAPGREWRLLVREEGMAYRTSLLLDLSPEDILEYWALLTPAQRAAYLEEHGGVGEELEGLVIEARRPLESRENLFDRFAGLYHAFGCLRTQVEQAILEGRPREAELRLLGEKHDSLPCLLRKVSERLDAGADPVLAYVTFLSARQLRDGLKASKPDFFSERSDADQRLASLLAELPAIRERIPLADKDAADFFEWYEEAFLREIQLKAGGA